MERNPVPTRTMLAACLLGLLLAIPTARAEVDLIAVGKVSGNISDLSAETAAPLENDVSGDLLGGIGSGLAYAGCNTFLAIPDRGPNAVPYNGAVDDTASYINRFHTIRLNLTTSTEPGLPFTLTPTLTATTLLHTARQLVYGDGSAGGAGFPGGAPDLNRQNHTHYFTGRSSRISTRTESTATTSRPSSKASPSVPTSKSTTR
jgi:hypothetical protein